MGKKVLHIIDHMGLGGAQILLSQVLPQLKQYGYDIEVCVLRQQTKLSRELEEKGICFNYLNSSKYEIIKCYFKLRKLINQVKPQIVHLHLDKANFLGALAALKEKVAIVIRHDHSSTWPPLRRYLLQRWVLERVLPAQTYVIAVSKAVKKFNEAIGVKPERIKVIYNGINVNEFSVNERLRKPQKFPIIGFVGRLHFKKGVKYLIKAVACIAKEKPEVKLYLVGDGPERTKLMKLAKKLGLDSQVVFFGSQKNPKKFYRLFTVFVMPSLYEACPIALMEAMVSSCPVIVSNIGGFQEIVTDGVDGYVTHKKDYQALAQKILYLLNNPQQVPSLTSKAAKKIKQNFHINLTCQRIISEYNNLLDVKTPLELKVK